MATLLQAHSETDLFISDLQIPFEHPKALETALYAKRHYRVADENCYCVGDETDQYFGGLWKKSIDATHTANSEIQDSIERLKAWYAAFPKLKLAVSNHGTRWQRKAAEADIPSIIMRRYEDVIQAPKGWIWQKRWLIRRKEPILMEHGDRFGTQYPHMVGAQSNSKNTVIGHHHSIFGVEYYKTNGAMDGCPDEAGVDIWGMCVGSLIDFERYAFHYGRDNKRKPKIGLGLVFNSGQTPFLLPMEDP